MGPDKPCSLRKEDNHRASQPHSRGLPCRALGKTSCRVLHMMFSHALGLTIASDSWNSQRPDVRQFSKCTCGHTQQLVVSKVPTHIK